MADGEAIALELDGGRANSEDDAGRGGRSVMVDEIETFESLATRRARENGDLRRRTVWTCRSLRLAEYYTVMRPWRLRSANAQLTPDLELEKGRRKIYRYRRAETNYFKDARYQKYIPLE